MCYESSLPVSQRVKADGCCDVCARVCLCGVCERVDVCGLGSRSGACAARDARLTDGLDMQGGHRGGWLRYKPYHPPASLLTIIP